MKVAILVLNRFTHDTRVLKTSETLRREFHDVTVVARHELSLPIFDVLESGVKVHRIPTGLKNWSSNRLVQIVRLIVYTVKFVTNYRDSDVIHCNDLDGLLVGVICKLSRPSILIVYDSHEFASNNVPFQSKLSIFLTSLLERSLIRFAKKVVCVSESIASEYARLYGCDMPVVVLNCPRYIEQPRRDLFRQRLGIGSGQKIFLYQGLLSKGREVELLLKAFRSFDSNKCVLVFMGYGPLENLVRDESKMNQAVFFHPAVSPDELLDFTASADYGVCFIKDSCLSKRYCLPNKVFEYLMAGLPIVTSNLVELRRLVNGEGVGIMSKDNTVECIENALVAALELDYPATRQNVFAARRKYCWEAQETILKKLYRYL